MRLFVLLLSISNMLIGAFWLGGMVSFYITGKVDSLEIVYSAGIIGFVPVVMIASSFMLIKDVVTTRKQN